MIRRLCSLLLVAAIALILFYISRFWDFRLWGRDGLFGIQALRPQGGLLAIWLRGTPFAPYELLIWTTGSFLILTWVQKFFDLITPNNSH
ncbi:MAG: hypothetical protein GDA36_04105 [Rhodobacteraceae bacterium]|nr:hypothetical protein [Paracoccaceae bacterium]